jgi:hypothetical protein
MSPDRLPAVTAVIYLVVAGLAAIGLAQTMRSQARGRRYLENSPDEHPLQLSHLSRPLQTLLRDTRALRLALEGPLRQLSESAMLGDHEELQQHLHDSARELGEWLRELDRLPKNDREYVADAGADPDRIRTLFELEGWSFDRKRPQGQPPLRDRMRAIVDELRAFEERLQVPPNPYR